MQPSAAICKRSEIGIHVYENTELDEEHDFPVVIARHGTPVLSEEIDGKWLELLKYNPNKNQWTGWEAIVALNDKASKIVAGAYVINNNDQKVGKMAYYTVKNDPDHLLYLVCAGDENCMLYLFPKENENAIKENLDGQLRHNRNLGFRILNIEN